MIANYNDAGLDLSYDLEFYALMADSFERSVGRRLTPEGRGAEWLYDQSPAVVLAHNTDADPRFIYANRAAQPALNIHGTSSSLCHRAFRRRHPIARNVTGC